MEEEEEGEEKEEDEEEKRNEYLAKRRLSILEEQDYEGGRGRRSVNDAVE